MDRARAAGLVVSLALLGATLEPLVRQPYDDGFPLSTYPMFATSRPTKQTFHYALGVTADGARVTLSPEVVGSGEILQALQVLEHGIGGGRASQARLCDAIAARVAHDGDFANIVAIRLVTGTHDAVDYLAHDEVGTEIELYRCEVKR